MANSATAGEWDDAEFRAAVERVAAEGVIEAVGVRLTKEQLDALLHAAPRSKETGRGILRRVDFSGTTFSGDAGFQRAAFSEHASFRGATFSGSALFGQATFSGNAAFNEATFNESAGFGFATFDGEVSFETATISSDARFDWATFGAEAVFDGATFSQDASFMEATFSEDVRFSGATFDGDARFSEATFSGTAAFWRATFSKSAQFMNATFRKAAWFGNATFSGNAAFTEATFNGQVELERVTFRGDAELDGATFEHATVIGPIHVFERLWLDGAVFANRVVVAASARRASLARTVFRGGGALRLRWAEVWLEDAEFAGPLLAEELQPRLNAHGEKGFLGWEKPEDDGTWTWVDTPPEGFTPSVLSLRDARVAHLALSGVDLRQCRFARAQGLDDLAYDRAEFCRPPRGWQWIRWRPVRWTPRLTIAEEHRWRAVHPEKYGRGWDSGHIDHSDIPSATADGSAYSHPWPPVVPAALGGEEIADIYRALRKGREDRKDEPGAADFYYGEMEMRRHSSRPAERTILWMYWAVSGYGLRASRALLALAVTIVIGAVLLQQFGFDAGKQPDDGTLLFAVESSISLFRAPEGALTAAGHVIQIVLRLAGPLFFGLALLALRGRVKR